MDKNTSRRNFIAGLATGAVALPLAATSTPVKNPKMPTLDELKPGLKYAINGYLVQWMFCDNLTREQLDKIESDVGWMFHTLQMDGILYEYKVVASSDDDKLEIKIGLKTEPSVNFKIWTCTWERTKHG